MARKKALWKAAQRDHWKDSEWDSETVTGKVLPSDPTLDQEMAGGRALRRDCLWALPMVPAMVLAKAAVMVAGTEPVKAAKMETTTAASMELEDNLPRDSRPRLSESKIQAL